MNAPIHFLAVLPPLDNYPASTVIVDALHGTGLSGEVRGASRQAIDAINASGLPVMAIDMPSGLCSDTGAVLGACVKADLTMTFIGRKKGMLAGAGPAMCGKVVFDDLGVPPMIYRKLMPLSQA
jgi:NAD(P)H-hydrate epimerase